MRADLEESQHSSLQAWSCGSRSFIEPNVLAPPGIVNAVGHRNQPFELRPPAVGILQIEQDRTGVVLGQLAFDLPHQPLAFLDIGLCGLALDQIVDLGADFGLFCGTSCLYITRLLKTPIIGRLTATVDSLSSDTLAGLSKWGTLRMPPCFWATAVSADNQSNRALAAVTAQRPRLIPAPPVHLKRHSKINAARVELSPKGGAARDTIATRATRTDCAATSNRTSKRSEPSPEAAGGSSAQPIQYSCAAIGLRTE